MESTSSTHRCRPARCAQDWGGLKAARRRYTLDATQVSMDTIGRNIPNTPMIGALIAATGLLELDELLEDTRRKLSKKLRPPEVVDKNMEAIKRAYREVAS